MKEKCWKLSSILIFSTIRLRQLKITSLMDAALTQDLIQNLTRILRYSITDLEKETTICQDLKIIEDYLMIHKISFRALLL